MTLQNVKNYQDEFSVTALESQKMNDEAKLLLTNNSVHNYQVGISVVVFTLLLLICLTIEGYNLKRNTINK